MDTQFDVIIIGGGATGLGVAVEAIARGYKTLLLEAHDFGKGTSSKSTKLIHGGIRYLANFDIALVREGLEERFNFLRNAPHIAHSQSYLVPFYSYLDKIKYFLGIHLYDFLSGKKKVGKSKFLNLQDTLTAVPDINPKGLLGGAIYFDGQFDDTRMLVTLLKTFTNLGGVAKNYHIVTGFLKGADLKISGVKVLDKLSQTKLSISAKVVINATGTLTDQILDIDEPMVKHQQVAAAQGTHLVFEREVFDSTHALVIPKTIDKRILFILPWHDKVIAGTTDIKIDTPELDPTAQASEVQFILDTLNQYTKRKVTRSDIKSIFAGQRPLVKPANQKNTAKISRKHEILYSKSGLITIVGGKWTIYRLMGEDAINFAVKKHLLNYSRSITAKFKLFGYTEEIISYPLGVYGSEYKQILALQQELNNFDKLHPELPYFVAEVIYQVRYEMVKTVEDVLARRTRALLLNAQAAIEAAPEVAKLIAHELNKDQNWIDQQLREFRQIAKQYLV